MVKYKIKSFFDWSYVLVFCLLAITIICMSLGQYSRWDFLEQLSMADRFISTRTFYPSPTNSNLTGVSVYFPALAFLTSILIHIIPDNFLIEIMLLLGCLVIFWFYNIQKYIVKSISSNFNSSKFLFLVAIFWLFLTLDWLYYATEFKPDTISFCFGCFGIIISGADQNKKKGWLFIVLGALFVGGAISFKQQYVAFLVGMVIYSIVKRNSDFRKLTIVSVLIAITIIYMFKLNSNVWFWTITVLGDDPLLSAKEWLGEHLSLIIRYVIALVILLILLKLNYFKVQWTSDRKTVISFFLKSPFILIMIFVAGAAAVSSLKAGGNSGNTAFGISVLFPIIYLLLKDMDFKIIQLGVILILFAQSPRIIFGSLKKYQASIEFINAVKALQVDVNSKIVTGSNTYGASRWIKTNSLITNYWPYAIMNNSKVTEQLPKLSDTLIFDYYIVENFAENEKYLENKKNVVILYKNSVGIVAKFN